MTGPNVARVCLRRATRANLEGAPIRMDRNVECRASALRPVRELVPVNPQMYVETLAVEFELGAVSSSSLNADSALGLLATLAEDAQAARVCGQLVPDLPSITAA
jgi:hypothetical protein